MKKITLSLSLIFLTVSSLLAQTNFLSDSLDAYIRREMKIWQVPGLAVCVIKDSKIVVMNGYGVREMNKPEPVDEHTLFMIGSNSKAFTATALALLENEGKISIDDKITKWLPTFKLYDDCATGQATVRDMLCHRSGLKTFQGDFTYWESDLTRQQVIEKLGKNKPAYDFRTRYGYCNACFVTAGEVIPAATGKQWETMIQEKIFTPLAMTRTVPLTSQFPKSTNIAAAHTVVQGKLLKIPYCQIDNLAAAGSIGSSVNDLSHWLKMQLDTGQFEGKTIVPYKALAKTRSGNTVVGSRTSTLLPTHLRMYGLGWFIGDYAGKQIIQHEGGVNGFVTQTCFVPEEKLGIVILTNTDQNALYQALMYQILDTYLNQPYRNYSQIFWKLEQEQQKEDNERISKLHETVAKNPKPILPLEKYTGVYENEVYGTMEIKLEQGKLNIHFSHHPGKTGRLEYTGGHDFLCTYSDVTLGTHILPFTVENRQVKSVSVKVNDFVEYDPYVFVKK
jgi:CubicO group peptidase (beta-lactamase class C family)